MTLKEFEEKIKGKYEITKVQTTQQFILRLGNAGSVILQYKNNEFQKFLVDGKQKQELEKLLSE